MKCKCNDCFKQQKSIDRIKTKWIREDKVFFFISELILSRNNTSCFRIHDDVVKWVKSIQKAVGEAGDILLNDVDINFGQSVGKVKFVGNKEFLSLITKDQVGYLQLAEVREIVEVFDFFVAGHQAAAGDVGEGGGDVGKGGQAVHPWGTHLNKRR